MKTRTSYVSNSSSSSFVVVLKDDSGNRTIVTDEQEKILQDYGFKYIKEYWKHAFSGAELFDDKSSFSKQDSIAMYYDVVSNEDTVEDFLFENRIPFIESEEYDTRIIHYDGIHDYYEQILNEGNRLLMYCFNGNEEVDEMIKQNSAQQRPFTRIRISDGTDITNETFKEKQ